MDNKVIIRGALEGLYNDCSSTAIGSSNYRLDFLTRSTYILVVSSNQTEHSGSSFNELVKTTYLNLYMIYYNNSALKTKYTAKKLQVYRLRQANLLDLFFQNRMSSASNY